MESYPAQIKRIARHRMALRLGGLAHSGDISDPKRQAAHEVARAVNEAEAAIGKCQLGLAALIFENRNPDDPSPMFGQPMRIWTLHLHADQSLRHILADRFLPVRSGRWIGAENIVAA